MCIRTAGQNEFVNSNPRISADGLLISLSSPHPSQPLASTRMMKIAKLRIVVPLL
jgi:hypothetical protein